MSNIAPESLTTNLLGVIGITTLVFTVLIISITKLSIKKCRNCENKKEYSTLKE
jgi:hypothetical protein